MIRTAISGIIFVLLFLLAAPIFLAESLLFTYGDFSFIKRTLIPRSYEAVLPFVINKFMENIPASADPKGFEKWFTKEFSKETYDTILSQAVRELEHGVNGFVQSGQLVLDFKNTKKTLITEIRQSLARFPVCPEGVLMVKSEGLPTCLPANLPPLAKTQALQALEDELALIIPPRIAVEQTNQYPWIRYVAFVFKNVHSIRLAGIAIFFALLSLMAVVLFRPLERVSRWVGFSFFLNGLEAFALFLLLKKAPPLISEEYADIIRFFIVFPERILVVMAVVFVMLAMAMFFFGYRRSYELSEFAIEKPALVIRNGRLRKGSAKHQTA